MATGKYLSLEEARKQGKLDRFCKEHPSTGRAGIFDELLAAMTKTPVRVGQTLRRKRRGEG